MIKEVKKFYNDNYSMLGHRERIIFNGFYLKVEPDNANFLDNLKEQKHLQK